jgi:hypothetical protein
VDERGGQEARQVVCQEGVDIALGHAVPEDDMGRCQVLHSAAQSSAA